MEERMLIWDLHENDIKQSKIAEIVNSSRKMLYNIIKFVRSERIVLKRKLNSQDPGTKSNNSRIYSYREKK